MIDGSRLYKTLAGYQAVMAWYDETTAALPVPHEARYIDTRHGKTHLLVMGDPVKPPLIMIQGFGASAPLWKKQVADFAREYCLYALDIPGHPGKSEARVPSLLDDSYAEWLIDALDALAIPRAPVCGVCLGGWVAMRSASYAPERVEKLVLLSPVGLAQFKVFVRSGVPLILNFGKERDEAGRRLLKMAFTPPGSGLSFDRDVARALMLVIKHYNIAALAGFDGARPALRDYGIALRTLLRFVRAEPDHALAQIQAPTLLLVGEYEAIYNPHAALKKALRAIPDVRAEIVPGTGHATIYDRPDYVNPRVLAFLRDGA